MVPYVSGSHKNISINYFPSFGFEYKGLLRCHIPQKYYLVNSYVLTSLKSFSQVVFCKLTQDLQNNEMKVEAADFYDHLRKSLDGEGKGTLLNI